MARQCAAGGQAAGRKSTPEAVDEQEPGLKLLVIGQVMHLAAMARKTGWSLQSRHYSMRKMLRAICNDDSI